MQNSKLNGYLDPSDVKNKSFFDGYKVGATVPINKKFPDTVNNRFYGYYGVCDTITRFAVDEQGFVYLNASDYNQNPIILAYGLNEGGRIVIGVGLDAMSAKADMANAYHMKTVKKFSSRQARDDFGRPLAGQSEIIETQQEVFTSCEERQWFNPMPRSFTWHFGLGQTYGCTLIGNVLYTEGNFSLVQSMENTLRVFQKSSNDYSFELPTEAVDVDGVQVILAKSKVTHLNSQHGYILFTNVSTVLGTMWEGYESETNPYADGFEEALSAVQQKIAGNYQGEVNSRLGRGENPAEAAKAYFAGQSEFSATPADSRATGNCATGTVSWMVKAGLIETPSGSVSWDNFPVSQDQMFTIAGKKAAVFASENYRFQAVMNRVYFKTFPEKEGLKVDQVADILFDFEGQSHVAAEEFKLLTDNGTERRKNLGAYVPYEVESYDTDANIVIVPRKKQLSRRKPSNG